MSKNRETEEKQTAFLSFFDDDGDDDDAGLAQYYSQCQ